MQLHLLYIVLPDMEQVIESLPPNFSHQQVGVAICIKATRRREEHTEGHPLTLEFSGSQIPRPYHHVDIYLD